MKTLYALLIAILLAGCAAAPTVEPPDDPNAATIVGQIERDPSSLAVWKAFVLVSVDSKPVQHGFMADQRDTIVTVQEGERRLVIQASFNMGFGSSGPWEAIVLLRANVVKGNVYRIYGEVRDDQYFVWLENPSTRTRLSGEASGPYVRSPRGGYAPVFIPVPRR